MKVLFFSWEFSFFWNWLFNSCGFGKSPSGRSQKHRPRGSMSSRRPKPPHRGRCRRKILKFDFVLMPFDANYTVYIKSKLSSKTFLVEFLTQIAAVGLKLSLISIPFKIKAPQTLGFHLVRLVIGFFVSMHIETVWKCLQKPFLKFGLSKVRISR